MIRLRMPFLAWLLVVCCLSAVGRGQQVQNSISGTVLDVNGGVVSGARVIVNGLDPATSRSSLSDDSGGFHFSGLPAGRFQLRVEASGLSTYSSAELILHPGEHLVVPELRLAPAAITTNVQVVLTEKELATEQVQAQEQQRALGIFPNFYSSYIWNAAPMTSGQKFGLAARSIADPFTFIGTGLFAAAEQWQNTSSGYGQGAQGYAKRYGAAYADEALSRMIGSAIMPSLLHQDPRYFYRGSGSIKTRAFYAIKSAVICRGDSGKLEPNYSYLVGAFASGGISNLYHPANDRGLGLVVGTGFLNVGSHALDNLVREFLLRKLTPKVPDYAQGKP
jgi:Carboxypeptidase regulatory-like domain